MDEIKQKTIEEGIPGDAIILLKWVFCTELII